MQYAKDLEDESFNSVTFIEQIAEKAIGQDKSKFNVDCLEEAFASCTASMKLLHSGQMRKCRTLKSDYARTEEKFKRNLSNLQTRFSHCQSKLRELDGKVNNVAMKIMHLGGQLESVNIPRMRAVEAYKLMTYFSEFLGPNSPRVDTRDDIDKINEMADIIRKLFLIAQELPSQDDDKQDGNAKFQEAKKKISSKYYEVERILIEEFVKAQCANSLPKMRDIAKVLSHFKGYSQCVDAFIEQSQHNALPVNKNIFRDLVPLCEKNFRIIDEVFQNAEQVKEKFVLNLYQLKLHSYISTVLLTTSSTSSSAAESSSTEDVSGRYLQNLTELYERVLELNRVLKGYNLGKDESSSAAYLDMLTKSIFQKYLAEESYISAELRDLKQRFSDLLQKYYNSLGHQKKQIYAGSFQGFRRELQAAIGTRANINIAQIEDYGGEIFLSDQITNSALNLSKQALDRCSLFANCTPNSQYSAAQIFELSLLHVINEYVNYAIDLGINSIPIPELKSTTATSIQQPDIYFFRIVREATSIVNSIEKQFADSVLPLIGTDTYLQDCLSKKDNALAEMEEKLDAGLDSSLNTIVGWIKLYLQTEQKKTDFKPEFDIDIAASAACKTVVQFLQRIIREIKDCLDGQNLQNLLLELSVRFHRTIYEHLLQYTYNESGALRVICDVNEYRKCVKDLNFPLTNALFDTLHALCNLLLVKAENLEAICSEQVLAVLDNSVLLTFIQLRSDFKSLKLSVNLKTI